MGKLWHKPILRTDEEEGNQRKATWLELFFDLVFIVVIKELAHFLEKDISFLGVSGFVLLFLPIFLIWAGSTFYNERFGAGDISHRLFTFIQMLIVAAFALSIHSGLSETSTWFALTYAAVRIVQIIMWVRAGNNNPRAKKSTSMYATGDSISVALWILSIFVPIPARFALWVFAILIDFITPSIVLKNEKNMPKLSPSHLTERMGLFFIIVVGESIIEVIRIVARGHISPITIQIGGFGILVAFCLWWLYFDQASHRPFKDKKPQVIAWATLHLPLLMAVTALSAGIVYLVEHPEITKSVAWLIAGSVALALVSISLIEKTLKHKRKVTGSIKGLLTHFGSAFAVLVLGYFATSISLMAFLIILSTILILQVIYALNFLSYQLKH
jgi:low temperature requirement protein LtrA